MYPAELEPLIEKIVNGMTPDQLPPRPSARRSRHWRLTKAHALASPNDDSVAFAGQLRQRLSFDLRMLQQNQFSRRLRPNWKKPTCA